MIDLPVELPAAECTPVLMAIVVDDARVDAGVSECGSDRFRIDSGALDAVLNVAPWIDRARWQALPRPFFCAADTEPSCHGDRAAMLVALDVPASWRLALAHDVPTERVPVVRGEPVMFFALPYLLTSVRAGDDVGWAASLSPVLRHGGHRVQMDWLPSSGERSRIGSAFWGLRRNDGAAEWALGRFDATFLSVGSGASVLHGLRFSTDPEASRLAALSAFREARSIDVFVAAPGAVQWRRDGLPVEEIGLEAGRARIRPPAGAADGARWSLVDAAGVELGAVDEPRGGLLGLPGEGFIDLLVGHRPGRGAAARAVGQRSFNGRWSIAGEWDGDAARRQGLVRGQWSPTGDWFVSAGWGEARGQDSLAGTWRELAIDWQGNHFGARGGWQRRAFGIDRTLADIHDLSVRWTPPNARWGVFARAARSGSDLAGGGLRWDLELRGSARQWNWQLARRCDSRIGRCESVVELRRPLGATWRVDAGWAPRTGGIGLGVAGQGQHSGVDWSVEAGRRADGVTRTALGATTSGLNLLLAREDALQLGVASGAIAWTGGGWSSGGSAFPGAQPAIVVDAPGAAGLRVRAAGADWSRADSRGRVVLPVFETFAPVALEIDAASIPLDVELQSLTYRLEAPRGRALRYRLPAVVPNAGASPFEPPWLIDDPQAPVGTPLLDRAGRRLGVLGHDGVALFDAAFDGEGVALAGRWCARMPGRELRRLRCVTSALR